MGGRGGSSHAGGGGGEFTAARDFLTRAYGITHTQAIIRILESAPDFIKEMWKDFAGKFRAAPGVNVNTTDAYYSPLTASVTLGINDVARGDSISTPYSTLFHEYGHMTDYLIAREAGRLGKAYSETYKGGLLGQTAKMELSGHIARIRTEHPDMTLTEARQALIREAKMKYSLLDRGDISDMMEGAGINVSHPLGAGHGLSYWNTRDNGKEIFAEITSAEAAAPGSLKAIKDYFPQTYAVYREMLKERKKK